MLLGIEWLHYNVGFGIKNAIATNFDFRIDIDSSHCINSEVEI